MNKLFQHSFEQGTLNVIGILYPQELCPRLTRRPPLSFATSRKFRGKTIAKETLSVDSGGNGFFFPPRKSRNLAVTTHTHTEKNSGQAFFWQSKKLSEAQSILVFKTWSWQTNKFCRYGFFYNGNTGWNGGCPQWSRVSLFLTQNPFSLPFCFLGAFFFFCASSKNKTTNIEPFSSPNLKDHSMAVNDCCFVMLYTLPLS